ncbi:MAG: YcaO-like family protein, partial [Chloroflexi bacterium]|nr:YcaO-like family protein [Chloroflexota bacterium]
CASNVPLSWTIGIDLISGDSVLLPTDLVVLGRQTQSIKSFLSSSHGLAAGAVLVEAVLVGVLEVIEKHAVRAARNPARVIPDYLNALPIVGQLCQQIEEAGAELAVYDCSSRLGIPVYFARVWDAREPYAGVYSGSGAHLDPEIAVLRAITEAVQSRAVYIAGARDDLPSRAFEQHRAHASPSIIDRLRRQPSTATVDLAHAPSATTQTFEGDMNVVLGRLEAAELHECIAVDLTPPEFSKIASVVRVVVPGLAA